MLVICVLAVVVGAAVLSSAFLAGVVIWNVVGTYRLHARSHLVGRRSAPLG